MSVTVGSKATRIVAVAKPTTSIAAAAGLMRAHHVGALVVVEDSPANDNPVGIITDRDIVVEITAVGLDPEAITVGDVMSTRLAVAHEADGLSDAITLMRKRGVRRLPVVDARERLTGVLAIDDVLEALVDQLSGVVKTIVREQRLERASRRGPSDRIGLGGQTESSSDDRPL